MPPVEPKHPVFVQVMMQNDSSCRAIHVYQQGDTGPYIPYQYNLQHTNLNVVDLVPIFFDSSTTLQHLAAQILPRVVRSPPQKAIERGWKGLSIGASGMEVERNRVDNAVFQAGADVLINYSTATIDEAVRMLLQKIEERGWKDLLALKLAYKWA